MADNTVLNAGTGGDTIASDDIAGVKYQRVKVTFGVDGAAADVAAASPLPVDASGVAVPVTDNGGSLTVDNAALSVVGGGVEATAMRVTLANDSTGVLSVDDNGGSLTIDGTVTLGAGSAAIGKLAANSGVDIGDVDVLSLPALPTGTNTIGQVGLVPVTTGGLSMSKTVSAASTNATSVKASAGQVYGLQVMNLNAAARYLKLYNKASAPTVGTDTPVKTIMIPGNTAGAGVVLSWANGLAFGTGIAFALTTGIADTDTGAVAANEIVVNLDYK